jgi:hypothetical protein
MSNMSYCRFENTSGDVQDCIHALEEAVENGETFADFLKGLSSDHERHALKRMVNNCCKFVELYEEIEEE